MTLSLNPRVPGEGGLGGREMSPVEGQRVQARESRRGSGVLRKPE